MGFYYLRFNYYEIWQAASIIKGAEIIGQFLGKEEGKGRQSMETHSALNRCIGKNSVAVAKRLRRSVQLIYKWQEPATDFSESGTHNPLDTIEEIIEISMREGQKSDDALAPVHYLAQRFGLICLPNGLKKSDDLTSKQLVKMIKEFADLAQAASDALGDNKISINEARVIDQEGWEAVRAITAFLYKVEESTKKTSKK